jgi:hypothetical protein
MRKRVSAWIGAVLLASCLLAGPSHAESAPAQRLPSALLIYPLIDSDGGFTRDTLIELVNLTSREVNLSCFYVEGQICFEIGFFVTLTPNQPISWLASKGLVSGFAHSAIPPFFGNGELKCLVQPATEDLTSHNAIQGRVIVHGSDGQTIGYGAIGFQRLVPGTFDGVAELDGSTYARCPDEQHFAFLAADTGSETEIVLAPCTEDLENQIPFATVVQFLVINEFEQTLSASTTVTCQNRLSLRDVSSVFTRNTLGTETGHLIVRGVQTPVLSMLIDRFTSGINPSTAANEPAFRGGRAGSIVFP